MSKRVINNSSGFSLVEVMIGLGILGIVLLVMLGVLKNIMGTQKVSGQQLELEEIRRFLTQNLDCEKTLFDASGTLLNQCVSGNPFSMKDEAGNELIAAGSSRFGSFNVRGRCEPAAGGSRNLTFERIHVAKDGSPGTNPLTGEVATWQRLFKAGISLCPSNMLPKEVIVEQDIQMDVPTAITVAAFLLGLFEGPVVACGDSEWPDPMWRYETSLLYKGTAQCPRGYSLVGGGVDCTASSNGTAQMDPVPAANSGMPLRRTAYKIFNDPVYDEFTLNNFSLPERMIHAWQGACCIRVNTFPIPLGGTVIDVPLFPLPNMLDKKVYARCVRNG